MSMFERTPNAARILALASKMRMERAGEEVEDKEKDDAEAEESEDQDQDDTEDKEKSEEKAEKPEPEAPDAGTADLVFSQMKLIVDKRVMPIVEPSLKKLSEQLAKNMKTGHYDEITKAVGKVRRDLENINTACATIYKYVDKLNK